MALLLVAVVLGVQSCASSNAPRGWLDEPEDVATSGYGSWIEVKLKARHTAPVEGEFLAMGGNDSVFVLADEGFQAVPITAIREARIAVYRSQSGKAGLMTFGGTILSLSHGIGFILSGPIWILVGSLAAGSVSREPLHDVPSATWSEVSIYARYPQGLPPGLDRTTVQAKVKRPAGLISVTLKDGRVLWARKVEYLESLGYLLVEAKDGSAQYIGTLHVRSIVQGDGRDITKEVMKRRPF